MTRIRKQTEEAWSKAVLEASELLCDAIEGDQIRYERRRAVREIRKLVLQLVSGSIEGTQAAIEAAKNRMYRRD